MKKIAQEPRQRILAASLVLAILVGAFIVIRGIRPKRPPWAGALVEHVAPNQVGDKVGIRSGDVLLAWACGASRESITSPFDFLNLDVAHDSCGQAIRLDGARGRRRLTWVLGSGDWGVEVGPVWTESTRVVYGAAQDHLRDHQLDSARAGWQVLLSKEGRAKPWLASWLRMRAGQVLASRDEWLDTDSEFGAALKKVPKGVLPVQFAVLYEWADSFYDRSDWDGAENLFHRALSVAESIPGGTALAAEALGGLGSTAFRRGDLSKAEEYSHLQLETAESITRDSNAVATALNQLALAVWRRGNLAAAESYLRRGIEITGKLAPESIDHAKSVANLGDLLRVRGDLERAEELFRKAFSITRDIAPETADVAVCLHNLGVVAEEKGDLTAAQQYYLEALDLKRKTVPGSLSQATTEYRMGTVAMSQGDFHMATAYLNSSLAVRERLSPRGLPVAEVLNALGDIAWRQNRYYAAERNYRAALEIRGRLSPGSLSHAESLASLARILRETGRTGPALILYRQAVDALETQTSRIGGSEETRAAFRAGHSEYYEELISFLIEQHRLKEAFQVIERSRAQSLLETLVAGRVEIRAAVDQQLLERRRSVQESLAAQADKRIRVLSRNHTVAEVAAIDASTSELIFKQQELDAEIRLRDPAFANLMAIKPLSVAEVQDSLLDPNTILLEYALGTRKSYLFVITPGSFTVHTLPARRMIEELARRLHELLRTSSCSANANTDIHVLQGFRETCGGLADRLNRMILAPAVKDMATGKRLLVVADGAIQYVPFAALFVPNGRIDGTRNRDPLITEHEVVMLPSATVLAGLRLEQEHRVRPPKAVAILADPVFSSRDERVKIQMNTPNGGAVLSALSLPFQRGMGRDLGAVPDPSSTRRDSVELRRLIFSREEAMRIRALMPQEQVMTVLDFGANLAAATSETLAQYRIIHFSTHGVLDSAHPELSGLILSLVDEYGHTQKGFLGYQEIYNLKLPADLVVLSGCDTALGKEIWGEGLVGLTRGFMYAGAARVLASLWEVDDYATARLMGLFYEGLEHGHMRPAAALRAAQLKMLKDARWRSPYFWAAFELQGEWR